MPADKLRSLGPPPPPRFTLPESRRPTMERVMDGLLVGLYVCMFGAVFLAAIGLGLPKLLVAAHAAWIEALAVWGVTP